MYYSPPPCQQFIWLQKRLKQSSPSYPWKVGSIAGDVIAQVQLEIGYEGVAHGGRGGVPVFRQGCQLTLSIHQSKKER